VLILFCEYIAKGR